VDQQRASTAHALAIEGELLLDLPNQRVRASAANLVQLAGDLAVVDEVDDQQLDLFDLDRELRGQVSEALRQSAPSASDHARGGCMVG